MQELVEAFSIQRRVWAALFLREMQTRWGRRNLGFAWLFAEPLVFAFPVLFIWSRIRAPIEHGIPMVVLTWTGYMGILIFRHITNRSLHIIRYNTAVLYHSAVTPLDLVAAVIGLEAIGNLASVAFSLVILYVAGAFNWPADLPLMVAGFLYMTWWSLTIALLMAGLSERSEIVLHIWQVASYIYIILCGFMFMAGWLPPSVRGYALLLDPPLHCYEMIRAGFMGEAITTYYSIHYLNYVLGTLTLAGLWQMRHIRSHIEVL
jgi:capsular polysaccharide transport system permease protein